MKFARLLSPSLLCCVASLSVAAEDQYTLKSVDKLPQGFSEQIAAALSPQGQQVIGPTLETATVWLAKAIPVKPDFQPTLNVKYPFTPGQLIGALRVNTKAGFTDFRGQEVRPGLYTLRYGQQPVDGNHVGTSETYDFLLAIPADVDTKPAPITSFEDLTQESAKTVGSNHPAIYSLLPSDEKAKRPSLTRDEDHNYWIIHLEANGKKGGQAVKVPMKLILIGRTEA